MKPSAFTCTKHALDQIRERYGVSDKKAANQWVSRKINGAKESFQRGEKTHYLNGSTEAVTCGSRVITVMENNCRSNNEFIRRAGEFLAKELSKHLTTYRRQMRKVEIEIAECNLNFLKAKNPNVQERIQERMNQALDERERLFNKIKGVEYSAEHYGVDIGE